MEWPLLCAPAGMDAPASFYMRMTLQVCTETRL